MTSALLYSGCVAAFICLAVLRARTYAQVLKTQTLVAAAAVCAAVLPYAHPSLGAVVAIALLAVCAVTDGANGHVYDPVIATAAGGGVVIAAHDGGLAAATFAGLALAGIGVLLRLLSRGGLGWGDIKLFAVLGLLLGFRPAVTTIGIAFVTGACYAVSALTIGRVRLGERLPFAPFVALGCVASIVATGAI